MTNKHQVAARHNEGKTEFSYILDWPRAMAALTWVCAFGARKYKRKQWKLGGKPDEEYLDSAMRHIFAHVNGERTDPESGCLHIAHAAWNLLSLLELNVIPRKEAE